MIDVQCLWNGGATLGEGPVWDVEEQALFWVDIKAHAIYRLEPSGGDIRRWTLPGQVGCVALDARGDFIAALQHGIAHVERATGSCTVLVDPEPERPHNRFNDGKVDPMGRFWAGTLPDNEIWEPVGNLYVFDADGGWARRVSGVQCSNGIGWSPEGRTMYFTDSMIGVIWAFDFDLNEGALSRRRVFAQWPTAEGVPDGLAVDADGHVWSAVWDGWSIRRYAPSGQLVETVRLPVQRPTSCAFGGPGLDVLYVTSASIGLSDGNPLNGCVLAFEPRVKGLSPPRCKIDGRLAANARKRDS